MSTARIHTCFPATEEGRMNEYDWSDVALTHNMVVYVPVCAVEDQTWVPRTGAPVVVSTNAYRTTFPPAGAPYVTTLQDKLSCAVKGGDPLTVKGWKK